MEMVKEIKHIGHNYGSHGESIDTFEIDGHKCYVYEECGVDYLVDEETERFAVVISKDDSKQLLIADADETNHDPEELDGFVGYITADQYATIRAYLDGKL